MSLDRMTYRTVTKLFTVHSSLHQRHKPATFQNSHLRPSADFRDQLQFLARGRPDRHHHASALPQLIKQRWRHLSGRGRNKNGVERSVFRPTLPAIADSDLHAEEVKPTQRSLR